jgi:hypothetical protein
MTYQSEFMANKYAQVATHIGHARHMPAEWMHAIAVRLCQADKERQEAGKQPMTLDHLRQMATKEAKNG